VTGQAAWYDLRVRIEKAPAEASETEPFFEPLSDGGLPDAPDALNFGQQFRPNNLS